MSGMYTALASKVLFPLHERLKGHTTSRVLRGMERTQWWSRERLDTWRFERLRALLGHAGTTVPYYRDLFSRIGFDPGAIASLPDLARLPFLTKALIRANTAALKSEAARHLQRFNTGGSSGEPLVFYLGHERVSHDVAAKRRATRWWGVDIGDPEIVVWGSPIELSTQDRVRALRDRLLRTELLPAFEMSAGKLDLYVDRIRQVRPRTLFGYPSALTLIARHARARGVALDRLGIRVAFVTAERLYDEQRQTISEVYGCRVANGYGGRDAGFIAHECPSGGMHITAEDIVVETIGPDGNAVASGEAGEIVITHLATRDFPFVRYRTGDVGVLDTRACPCGRGLPLVREIQGRTTDFVIAADGTVMHGLAVVYPIRDLPGIAAFKVVQETRLRARVTVVPGPGFGAQTEARIVAGLKERLGRDVEVVVERVSEIPVEASGKFRYVKSLVHDAHGDTACAT
ncbi:MAG: phenylacetate--CoA ligase family protein [Burkholderiales bacterium]|nr:phenylacetate--CoA ligase family protein [Burkholderiales bacterium]